MKNYNKPEIKVLNVELTDIICTSGELANGGNTAIGGNGGTNWD